MFNADEFTASLQRPSITIDGETYTGRLLGFEDALVLSERFDRIRAPDASVTREDLVQLVRDVCAALTLPAEKVLALPMPAVMAAMRDFFAVQQAAVAMSSTDPEPPPAS